MILTQEQIDQLDLTGCQTALKQLERDYRLDTAISKLTKEEWLQADAVANTLLWLEDRIKSFLTSEIAQQANLARLANHTPKPKVERLGPKRKQFRIGDVIYLDVQTAALKTGVKVDTLRQYVTRKPDIYEYID